VAIQFNHTIVPARDAKASATWLSEVLGRDAPTSFGPFWAVALDNGATLDFQDSNDAIPVEHYAFLVSEQEFDAIFERIRKAMRRNSSPDDGDECGRHGAPLQVRENWCLTRVSPPTLKSA